MKDQLVFDTTDANTIADSDSVGAFIRSSDGTLITHSTVGGKEALDVSIADGINVEVDLSHVDDSVRLGDGTDFFTSTTVGADIGLDVNLINASIAVTATDLDIRDLAFATDSVTAHQGGTWTIDSITNAVTVTATQLDIDNLNATDDAVQSWLFDGTGTAITSTGGAIDVNILSGADPSTANTSILSGADTLSVAGTAEKVVASNLAARKYLSVYNNDNQKMYIGGSGVSSANGFPVSPGSYVELRAGAAVDVYYDSAKSGHAIRTLELS